MKYTIGLRCGGLMEDPEWHVEMVHEVEANSLDEAKDKWAALTGEDKRETWSPERRTVWGWELVQVHPSRQENRPIKYKILSVAMQIETEDGTTNTSWQCDRTDDVYDWVHKKLTEAEMDDGPIIGG